MFFEKAETVLVSAFCLFGLLKIGLTNQARISSQVVPHV